MSANEKHVERPPTVVAELIDRRDPQSWLALIELVSVWEIAALARTFLKKVKG
jgi:hypothetical protein